MAKQSQVRKNKGFLFGLKDLFSSFLSAVTNYRDELRGSQEMPEKSAFSKLIDEEEAAVESDTPLTKIYKALNNKTAKDDFAAYFLENEGPLIDEAEKSLIEKYETRFKKNLDWKDRQTSEILAQGDFSSLKSLLDEMKRDKKMPLLLKYNTLGAVIERLSEMGVGEQGAAGIVLNDAIKSCKRMEWELDGEKRIIGYILKGLTSKGTIERKIDYIKRIEPYVIDKIKDDTLSGLAETIFSNLVQFYEKNNPSNGEMAETDDGLVLPEFGEEEDAFIEKLSRMGTDEEISRALDELNEGNRIGVIEKIAFDDKFSSHFSPIVDHLNVKDMGKLIGLIHKKIKVVEQEYGVKSGIKFVEELHRRVSHLLGPTNIISEKIKNIKNNLEKSEISFTNKLAEMKRRIAGKDNQEKLQVLLDMSKDPEFQGIFGTVQNLERIMLEDNFTAVFENLPLETQKIVAGELLSDLGSLRKYHPKLIKKLERKLKEVTELLGQADTLRPNVNYDLIDALLGFAEDPEKANDSLAMAVDEPLSVNPDMEDTKVQFKYEEVIEEVLFAEEAGDYNEFKELGEVVMGGSARRSPEQLLDSITGYAENAETGNAEAKGTLFESIEIMKKIDTIPTIGEKITVIRYWLKNGVYRDKPYIVNVLEGMLATLLQDKSCENGLLSRLFRHLETLGSNADKIKFIEGKLEDPEYRHIRQILGNMITNLENESVTEPRDISEASIDDQLTDLPNVEDRLNWLKERKHFPAYFQHVDYIDRKIEELEGEQSDSLNEKLDEEFQEEEIRDRIAGKKADGTKVRIHDNIITLARAVMEIPDKVQRQLYIKEQEQLKELPPDNFFFKLRKLLYYLTGCDVKEKPSDMLKSLCSRVLLSPKQKREYLKQLKLARFKVKDEHLTLGGELGLTDEDIAYYAAYIIGYDKTLAEKQLRIIRNVKNGSIRLEDVSYAGKGGKEVTVDYRTFFGITDFDLSRVISDLEKLLSKKKAGRRTVETVDEAIEENGADILTGMEKVAAGIPGMDKDSEAGIDLDAGTEAGGELGMENGQDVDGGLGIDTGMDSEIDIGVDLGLDVDANVDGELETGTDMNSEAGIGEEGDYLEAGTDIGSDMDMLTDLDMDSDKGRETGNDMDMGTDAGIDLDEGLDIDTGMDTKTDIDADMDVDSIAGEGPDNSAAEESAPAVKTGESDEGVYEKNRMNVDASVAERIREKGREEQQRLSPEMEKKTEDAVARYKPDLKERMRSLLTHLSGCFPVAIPEIIEKTIVPVLIKNQDYEARDLINILNQNIFNPALYAGAEIDLNTSIDSIESFLKQKDILKSSMDLISRIIEDIQKARSNEIHAEVKKEAVKYEALKSACASGKVTDIIVNLLKVKQESRIVPELENIYLKEISGNPKFNSLFKKLNLVKDIIMSHREYNTADLGKFFDANAVPLILRLRERVQGPRVAEKAGFQGSKNQQPSDAGIIEETDVSSTSFHDSDDKKNVSILSRVSGKLQEFMKPLTQKKSTRKSSNIFDIFSIKPKTKKKTAGKTYSITRGKSRTRTYEPVKKKKPVLSRPKTQAKKKISNVTKEFLEKANTIITNKLIYLIRSYNTRQLLEMLYSSYLGPKARKSNLVALVDERAHKVIYDAIKNDPDIHPRLRFDMKKVMNVYNKKIKKVK
ncbi:MAG: hypothetical protein JW969_09530 [Spirochaetales bacterium]|nr:hypothetical protein [Spirochaetales bacterium]